ncbi:hypothetical protein NDU88_002266 [Pleurodeles waltl]|uniref:Zona pellucida sperm-binding protein 3 n=1 Tax=Pleurodeles waltl TaxID=8319 RepID=A0AAV7LJS9_PLEWA|nr:hypothetical protein NDU88_002266 [Pleurodeles waltl]
MGQRVFLWFVCLCLVYEAFSANSWGKSSIGGWSQLGLAESRLAAPGVFFNSPWSLSGSRALPPLQPVLVRCEEARMVVSVQRDLFGTGKLVQAADLKLGPSLCGYTTLGADNTVIFQVALQDCGNFLQVTEDSLIYSSTLSYNPTWSDGSRVITRTNPTSTVIQCIYPRSGNVSSNAIQPTWIPFSSTLSSEGSLLFSLKLMNDDWSAVRTSTTFHLGDVFNIEASVQPGNHAPLRVFVDSCVATLTPDRRSTPRYDLIKSNGCLVDGKLSDSSSAFTTPRLQQAKLQFTIDSFIFIGDSSSSIYITCNLKAIPSIRDPDSLNKACSYNKQNSSWFPVEGAFEICSCCDSSDCAARRKRNTRSKPANVYKELAVLGPLEILQQENIPSLMGDVTSLRSADGVNTWMVLGLTLIASAIVVSLMVLGAVVLYNKYRAGSAKV